MKKIISIVGVFIMWHMIGLLQSCIGGCDDGPIVFNLSSISSNLIRITEKEFIPESHSSINLPIKSHQSYEVDEDFIRFDSLGIDLLMELYSFVPKFDNDNILNSAFACSPAEKYDVISDISITSSENYAEYQAGELLNDIILIRTNYDTSGTLLSEFDSKLDYFLERHRNMLITFSLPPITTKIHNLTITIVTDNGEIFTETISGLKIAN